MKKNLRSTGGGSTTIDVSNIGVGIRSRLAGQKFLPKEKLDEIFLSVGQMLREGRSQQAEKILLNTIENYSNDYDDFANLKRLLAFTFETVGRYKESLDAVMPFEDEEILSRLNLETQVRVTTQLAISYNNLNDYPKAVTLLKKALQRAEENKLRHLTGRIDGGLSRAYRKLNECLICREHAEKALNSFRESGDWLGMAEAYREIALSYHQEGSSGKSLEYFNLAIQIIGERQAPFMLGRLYTEMSGAYWFLRRPQDGIDCLEKSIRFFDQTEHILNSVIAYNNLGINLTLVGEWRRAEEVINRALKLAVRANHVHRSGVLDSLGEIKLLRGEIDEAQNAFEQAIVIAIEGKREWYAVQAMRNLARCFLAQGKYELAAAKARETTQLCSQIGDKHYGNMATLVLAESSLYLGEAEECENLLKNIEATDPSSDFFVLGNIQRIRGLAALSDDNSELAIHHFNRSLTIFEAAEDLYHAALAHLLIGANLPSSQSSRAMGHLNASYEVFKRLGVNVFADKAKEKLDYLQNAGEEQDDKDRPRRENLVASQLLTVRLAEATASRELLFREFVAVLQQESRAKKIIIAQPAGDVKRIYPFITHGYSPEESDKIIAKYTQALEKGQEKAFTRVKNIAVFPLKGSTADPAYLLIHPLSGAFLNDGSPLQALIRVVELGMEVIALREKDNLQPVEQEISSHLSSSLIPGFIHSSPAMTSLVEEIYKIRSSDVTVLITGESGTGKELVSRAIHAVSNRKDKIFVPFNCTGIPKELAEGHLFGYRRGAFTGAFADSPGIIRGADTGTLFLDEIGDLPLDVQPKLLRFLQEGEIQPIGERRPIKVDVRVVAATNMPLEEKVANGTFREDLYYRLNVIRLRVPPLRERRSEIPAIVNYYVNHFASKFGKRDITFTSQTIDMLMMCVWEGNVRELCNEVQRIIARSVDGEIITPADLSPELKRMAKPLAPLDVKSNIKPIASYDRPIMPFKNISEGGTLEEAVTELEMQMIRASLTRHNWNISRVANELGLTRRGLYMKLTRYGIQKSA